MNKYELVYDLKEHLDTYSQTYDDYIMSYGEVDMIYHYIEEKDKKIERLRSIVKEVREYIEDKYAVILADDLFLDHDERIERKRLLEIIGILDKE